MMDQDTRHLPPSTIPAKRSMPEDLDESLINAKKSNPRLNQRNSNANGSVPEFIQKLFRMLDNKAFRNTFCWGADGNTFIVKDTNEFSKSILPKHFKHCNFASFVRQLNKYDFHKVRHADDGQKLYGDQAWEFVHPKFKKDRGDLLEEIRRKAPGKAKKEDPSTAATSESSNVATESKMAPPSDSLSEVKQIAESLQAQIDTLQKSQRDMEASLQRLNQTDGIILNELAKLSKAMNANDKLVHDFIQLAAQRDKGSNETHDLNTLSTKQMSTLPCDAQQLLDSYTELAQTNNNLTNSIVKQLQHPQASTSWTTTSMATPAPAPALIPEPPPVQTQTNGAVHFQPVFRAPTTTPVNQSQGSLVGSSSKSSEGVTILALGRAPEAGMVTHSQPSSSTSLSVPKKSDASGWTVPPRVLLVDDDSIFRDISGRLLQVIGCTIDSAKDGVEALRKMGLEKYDLILMDIVMPNLDGITATRSIRRYDPSTPIISMTSNFTENDIIQYVGSGMTDILPKPFTKHTLYSMLEKYCAHLKVIQHLEPNGVPRSLGTLGIFPHVETAQITELPSSQPQQPQPPQQPQQPLALPSSSTTAYPAPPGWTASSIPVAPQPIPSTSQLPQTVVGSNDPKYVWAAADSGAMPPGFPLDTQIQPLDSI